MSVSACLFAPFSLFISYHKLSGKVRARTWLKPRLFTNKWQNTQS